MSEKLTNGTSLLRRARAFAAAAAVAAKPTSARISKWVLYFHKQLLLRRSVVASDVPAQSLGRTDALLGHRSDVERATFPSSSAGDRQYPRHSEYDPRMYQHRYDNDVDVDDEPEDQ